MVEKPAIQSETSLQMQVAGLLDKWLAPPALYTAFPAGGGGEMRGKILRSMGLKSGWPDIQIIWGGFPMGVIVPGSGLYLLELKTVRGIVSATQAEMHKAIKLTLPGAQIAIARTLDEAKQQFEAWHLPRHEMSRSERQLHGLEARRGRAPFDDPAPH